MKTVLYPERNRWPELLKRPALNNMALTENVRAVMNAVKAEGDVAVRRFTKEFDGVEQDEILVSSAETAAAEQRLSPELKSAIRQAADNITRFHKGQLLTEEKIETMPGVVCWRRSVGIEKVGLYIPGGTAPLFSTILMLGIPAKIAGCKEIILCTPPQKDGSVSDAILFAAQLVGITKVFKIGGVQAIAAMAYGTATVPAVYKIFGPGNQYVTCAKMLVQQDGVAIDMPAGPSEVCVLCDNSADPAFVAADLLSQAEHGNDSQVLLVMTDEKFPGAVQKALASQVEQLQRKSFAEKALEASTMIVVKNMDDAIDLVNDYAAEHLIIACENATEVGARIVNAGSVFLGNYSPESVGDYASGTNHTLPTNGYAKAYSGVSVDSFVKKVTYQQLSENGLRNIADTVMLMAKAEGLDAHSYAVEVRVKKLKS
jgi:histidinol dehydrogenase